jgi:hypothetical protein
LPQAQALIDRLLAKSPNDRPPSAAHVLAEVEALQSGHVYTGTQAAPLAQTEPSLRASPPVTPLGWDKLSNAGGSSAKKLWIGATAIAVAAAALSIGLLLPPKAATPQAVVAPAPRKAPEPEPEPETTQSPITAVPQPAGAHAARTHTDVDDPVVLDGSVKHPADTLADVPTAESADDDEAEEEAPPRSGKARSRSARAARRAARAARSARRQASKINAEDSSPPPTYSAQSSVAYTPPAVASDDVLRRAPPFPSIAAAKRAHDSGKINVSTYEAAVNSLKARRMRRIAIEQQNLAQGKINAQEYEWRLGRIDQEYRGE